jgi:hypothetical protein
LLLSAPDGTLAVGIAPCYTGPIEEGERILKPVRSLGSPMVDLIAPRPYTEMQSLFDQNWVPGQFNYWKTSLMRTPSDAAIDILLEQARKRPTPNCVIYFQQLHGTASRVKASETAFPHRFDHYDCGPWAIWQDPADTDQCIRWARECWDVLRPFYEPSAYVNAVDDAIGDDDERVRSGIWTELPAAGFVEEQVRSDESVSPQREYSTDCVRQNRSMRASRSRAPSSDLGEEVDEVFDFAVRGPRWATG